jgi:hypothetical protein
MRSTNETKKRIEKRIEMRVHDFMGKKLRQLADAEK